MTIHPDGGPEEVENTDQPAEPELPEDAVETDDLDPADIPDEVA